MDIKEVKELIQEILQSDISEFELEHTGTKVKLRRGFRTQETASTIEPQPSYSLPVSAKNPDIDENALSATPIKTEETLDDGLHIITSPIVGTFYRAPSAGAEPYAKIGDKVEEGTILCVVEAMKLMNEIPSDLAGEVVRIYVENSHPVEFGQKLFGIRSQK